MAEHAAETPNRWVPSPKVRRYLYRVVLALGALALFYGYVSGESLPLFLALAAAMLDITLADANTPTKGT